ncbi:Epoxide hydrolase (EC [Olavius algarvensis Delta 1 endosymbiont]|nr:Epoxide hydrolase (EC [Olavius algarvensis Delta 1 endosymbiont]
MVDFQSSFAEVNGQRLHYISVGQGDLIMFVHGFPEFWREWENQLAEFGHDYQAVALDMRGYNLSSKPAEVEDYNAKHLVQDLKSLAEHLGHQQFTLVAHDWGGAAAWSAAMRYPECVKKLVIINSPHPAVFARELLNNPAQQAASQYMLLFRSAQAEQILAENNYTRLLEMVTQFGSVWDMAEDVQLKYREAWSQPGALTGGLNYYRASPLYPPTSPEDEAQIKGILDLPPEMLAVRAPTLVIWGEQDHALLTGNLDGLEDYVDDLTVKRIPDGSHWVIHEQPDRVNALIREFLS